VIDSGNAEQNGNAAAEQSEGIQSHQYLTTAPSEHEIAKQRNQRNAKNRERFIYRPFRRLMRRPIKWLIVKLDEYDGASTAAATIAIAILTGVLAWYANGQEKILTQQIEDSRASQRAFVFIRTFEVQPFGDVIRIMPQWKNSGTTPTVKMRSHDNWKWFPAEPPSNYSYPDLDSAGDETNAPESGVAFVGPQSNSYAAALDIPIDWIERVRKREGRIFIWGWAEYNDVFSDTVRHHTEFGNELVIKSLTRDPAGKEIDAALIFPICGRHNSAN
jgi:hypothetical protein